MTSEAPPDSPVEESSHLRTSWVFVDTQAYVKQHFDWSGPILAGLLRLAKAGTVKLLITSVTRREVLKKIYEEVEGAVQATRKYASALKPAGIDVATLPAVEEWKQKARAAFEGYLTAAGAVEVPLNVNVEEVLADYFDERPPFSTRKKAEFPDALALGSLKAWCQERGEIAYVVSGDRDHRAFCELDFWLQHAETIADVVAMGTASEVLHALVAVSFAQSTDLRTRLETELLFTMAETPKSTRHFVAGPISAEGFVSEASIAAITNVRILDIQDSNYCLAEVEFDASVTLTLNVEDRRDEDSTTVMPTAILPDVEEQFTAIVHAYVLAESTLIVAADVEERVIKLSERQIREAFLD